MTSRTQVTLDAELQRRARQRASDLGVSLAEYFRQLVARDLGKGPVKADPSLVFDLGSSGGSDIARHEDSMPVALSAGRGSSGEVVSLFVDTSVWYAAADSSDSSNSLAKAVLASSRT